MNSQRLLILGLVAAVGLGLALYSFSDPANAPADPTPSGTAKGPGTAKGVGSRAADAPFDLRERDRLKDENEPLAPPATEPGAEPGAESPAPPVDDPKRLAVSDEPPATVVGPPGSPTIEAAMTAAKAAAQDAVAEVRGEMRRKCWDTLDRSGVGDDGVELSLSLGFDAEGHVITSAVQQTREHYIQGLDTCLGPIAHGLVVPAPGEPVSISVEFGLP